MRGQFGISLIIALWTGWLSAGQAWVLRGRTLKFPKHLLVWVSASILVIAIGFALVGMQRDASKLRTEIIQLGIIAGIINGLSLLVAGRWKGRAVATADSFVEGAGKLAYIHGLFVVMGGGAATLVFALLRLSAVRW